MPNLYGQPFKDELRADIRRLNKELRYALSELRVARQRLIFRSAEIRELKAKNQELARLTHEMMRIAERPIEISAFDELQKDRKRRQEELVRSIEQAA